ncbi:MAG: hypothetical protein K0U47_00030 [Epsilonproteobacteria bacterium]|nr:hypothetical protein [Campylobacterota bacterium]
MTQRNFILFVAVSIVLLFLSYIQKEQVKSAYFESKKSLLVFEKEAKELASLKNKHKDKKTKARMVESLLKIKAPAKDYVKSDVRVLEFDGLTTNLLNRVVKKIQNSTIDIQKLEIIRESASIAKVRLEMKK